MLDVRSFVDQGYLHVRGAVPAHKITAARRLIHGAIGRGELQPGGVQPGMCKLGGGIAHHKTIRALYYGEAQALAYDKHKNAHHRPHHSGWKWRVRQGKPDSNKLTCHAGEGGVCPITLVVP